MDRPVRTGLLVGYARVSTLDQSLEMQVDALRRAGVHDDNIHTEKVPGISKKRPALELAIKDLGEGDTFLVWRLDRLARSVRQLYAALDRIYSKGAFFRSISEDFDFGTVSGKLVLGILGLVAEFERQLIAHRTSAAIAAVRSRRDDKHWGPAVFMTPKRIALVGDYLNGRNGKPHLSGPKVAKKLKVSTASIYAHWKQSGRGRFVRKQVKSCEEPLLETRRTVYDFLLLPMSQQRLIAERYGVNRPDPKETDFDWSKRVMIAIRDQGKQSEFADLIAEAKSR